MEMHSCEPEWGHRIKLSNGVGMPVIGLYCEDEDENITKFVRYAIEVGYRHFDCAWFHGNERGVGSAIQEAIKEGLVTREELFITTKLWNNFHARKKVVPSIKESLSALKLHYVDVYYIQWPFGFNETSGLWPDEEGRGAYSNIDYVETWKGMEECVKAGYTKSIGLCNFNSKQITRILQKCTIKPIILQIEVNPYMNQEKLINFCNNLKIAVIGCNPFGKKSCLAHTGLPVTVIADEVVVEIGRKHSKTAAQVVLKYLINRGIAVVVKANERSKILENILLYDFELDDSDTAYLDSLNRNLRSLTVDEFSDHLYYPFKEEF